VYEEAWYHPDMQKEIDMARALAEVERFKNGEQIGGLTATVDDLKTRLAILEQSYNISKQERELESKKTQLLDERVTIAESKMQDVKDWAKKREQDFRDIEEYAEELKRDEKFREDNK
jgi:hypothetical protein